MTLKTKSSANQGTSSLNIEALCSTPHLLQNHISDKLAMHKRRVYLYKEVPSTPAAVLIPIFFKNGQAHMLFTMRTDKVGTHKGQISYPGGRKDKTDSDFLYTALRETREEVGIMENDVTILGETDTFLTNTDFLVHPFVGLYKAPYPYKINYDEIARLIEVPLQHLLNPSIFKREKIVRNNITWDMHFYQYNQDVIWGVTGFLLSNFLSIIFGVDRGMENVKAPI